MNKKSQKGFTLIELLVVIAIISLLSSVILAVINDARDKAQQASYRQYLGQVVRAVELYRADHSNAYPESWETLGFVSLTVSPEFSSISPYIKKQKAPNFVRENSEGIMFTQHPDYAGFLCNNISTDDYVIYFDTTNPQLNFAKLTYYGEQYIDYTDPPTYYYCVSQSQQ